MSDVHQRLKRLLFLVPFVRTHPGITVDELAKNLAVKRESLLEELDLLTLVGRPPFQPDDYIDIYVENDRVYVDLDQRLSAPPRLTANEAAALAAAAALLRPAAGEALSRALAKLEKVLPPNARNKFAEIGRTIDASLEEPAYLAKLTEAIATSHEVTFDYFTQARGSAERRQVRPRELLAHFGQWYLSGFDVGRGEDRLFRLDRLTALTLEPATFQPEPGKAAALPPARGERNATVLFSERVAHQVKERFGYEACTARPGGAVSVEVPLDNERWLTQWVLSFGGEAEVLSPESARAAVARAAIASLES